MAGLFFRLLRVRVNSATVALEEVQRYRKLVQYIAVTVLFPFNISDC